MKQILFIISCLICFIGFAQDNYEIQVYGSSTMTKGETMLELHSNFTANGNKDLKNGVLPSNHSIHETIEITQGITDNFEIGFYIFTNYTPNYGWKIIGSHIRPRIAAPENWKLPVGLSLSAEIGFQKQEYAAETFNMELRPIIDKTFGKFYISLNPTLGFAFIGNNINTKPTFSPSFKTSFAASSKYSLGLEYYGDIGPLNQFEKLPQQNHAIFAVADLDLDPKWEVNFGPGFGFTDAADKLVFKLIVGRRLSWSKKHT